MKEKQIVEKIRNYIIEQKLPLRVREMIEKIYLDYEDSYKRYLSNIQRIINHEKMQTELNNIASFARREYEDDKTSTKEIEDLAFETKINKSKEEISSIIVSLQREGTNTLISTNSEDEKKEESRADAIKKHLDFSKENKNCAVEIRESVISEIESSKKTLITRIQSSIPRNEENVTYINYAREAFENEVNLILNKAKLQIPTEIESELKILDDKIIEDVIDMYNQENVLSEGEQENTIESKRKNFVEGLQEEIDEDEAFKKVLEEQQRQTALSINGEEDKYKQDLPDNAIE